MAAFIVIDQLSVTDAAAFGDYEPLACAALQCHDGAYVLPPAQSTEALEGNWKPNSLVVIEFKDAQEARSWWTSAEYARARALHRQATISNVILIDSPHVAGMPAGRVVPTD